MQYKFLDCKWPPPPLELFQKFIRFGSATLPSVVEVGREVLGQLIIIGNNKQKKLQVPTVDVQLSAIKGDWWGLKTKDEKYTYVLYLYYTLYYINIISQNILHPTLLS